MMGLLAMKRLLELTGWLASVRWPGSAGLHAKAAHWPIGRCPQPYSLHSTAQTEQKFSWIRYVSQKYVIISFMSQYNQLSGSISKRPASAGHLAGTFSSDPRPHLSVEEVLDAKKKLVFGREFSKPGGISSATPSTIWERVLSAGWEHLATPRVVPTGLRPPPLGKM